MSWVPVFLQRQSDDVKWADRAKRMVLNIFAAMIALIAKYTVIVFGIFLICAGLLMFLLPEKARQILRRAGSTNVINYTEITLRMIPAAGLILYADFSKFPEVFKLLGWFMLGTSIILYFVPRQMHHRFSVRAAELLKPLYFQFISPFALLFGGAIIYCVI